LSSGRYFFAVWPPAPTAAALERWASPLEGRHIPAEKIHLTLAFLGVVDPAKAQLAARAVRAAAHRLPIDKAHYWRHNRILWVGPRETPAALKGLVEALHFELERGDYALERRPYAAHVTLARSAAAPRELPPLPQVEWPVSEFTLVNSRNAGRQSVYQVVDRYLLFQ